MVEDLLRALGEFKTKMEHRNAKIEPAPVYAKTARGWLASCHTALKHITANQPGKPDQSNSAKCAINIYS